MPESNDTDPETHPDTWGRLVAGCRQTLARALTLIENDAPGASDLLGLACSREWPGRVIGVTGAPGTGKSTLVGALIRPLRARGLSLGILAVDPSSARTGGAVLGDRLRMPALTDEQVFIRSVATRGRLGGLSLNTARMVEVMLASGKDLVIVETVGTGQSEIEIAQLADQCVVVLAPGLGDGIQALKAGVMEIADLMVVNKNDLPGADRCESDLRQALAVRRAGSCEVPILRTSAHDGDGIEALVDALTCAPTPRTPRAARRIGALVADQASRLVRAELLAHPGLAEACARVLAGEASLDSAARGLLENRPRR